MAKANKERWKQERDEAASKVIAKAQQKAANAASDNAAVALRIKGKLLRKLEKEIDDLPDSVGSETRQTIIDNQYDGKGNRLKQAKEISKAYKLVELATTFEKLTKGMNIDGGEEPVRIVIDV